MLADRRDRIVLAIYKNPKYLSLSDSEKEALIRNSKYLRMSREQLIEHIKKNPKAFVKMYNTHAKILDERLAKVTVSDSDRQMLTEIREQLNRIKKDLLKKADQLDNLKAVSTEETKKLQQARLESKIKRANELIQSAQRHLANPKDLATAPKAMQMINELQEALDHQKTIDAYNKQRTQ